MTALLLLGCAPRTAQIQTLVEAGYAPQVYRAYPDRVHDRVDSAVWDALDLRVAMEVVPAEAFGVTARGYGSTWWLVSVGLDRRPGVTRSLHVDLDLGELEACPTCDGDWVRRQLGPERREPERKTGGGLGLGAFLGDLFRVGKIVGAALLLPVTLVVDTTTAIATPFRRNRPAGLTRMVWDAATGDSPRVRGATQVEGSDALLCEGDGPCAATLVLRGTTVPTEARVRVELKEGLRTLHREVVVPLEGDDLPAALASAFPTEGVRLDLPEPPP
ncbi:MAG: hypothetical protein KC656_32435 [Myxococcales bacterium]|nr:hypothetical protein [Myxococcales bacterium]